jgi:hypothetical protein
MLVGLPATSCLLHVVGELDAVTCSWPRMEPDADKPAAHPMGSRAESFENHLKIHEADAAELERRLQRTLAEIEAEDKARKAADEDGMDIHYSGCYLDEDEEEQEWWPEAILGRRIKGNKLYYKVKWRGRNVVSWELDDDIENRVAVDRYERAFKALVAPAPSAPRRFGPATYISLRRLKAKPELAVSQFEQLQPTEKAVWCCEVEPFIWIPYDDSAQRALEEAYRLKQGACVVKVAGRVVTINLRSMMQETSQQRPVQRSVVRSEEAERRHIDSLSLNELRRYIATIVEFTPLHYEVLSRLHEADKVTVTASKAELSLLIPMTFGSMIEQIANGVEFVGFSDECHICLEDYQPDAELAMLPNCGHAFHRHCITDYFGRYSKLCPVCKAPL